jgi:hypothetical protein
MRIKVVLEPSDEGGYTARAEKLLQGVIGKRLTYQTTN